MATTQELLCHAIRSNLTVIFTKDGDGDEDPRVGEPHLLFVSTTGKVLAAIFQTGGYSSSGSLPEWRNFDVDTISVLPGPETAFTPRADFNRNNPMYAKIVCERS